MYRHFVCHQGITMSASLIYNQIIAKHFPGSDGCIVYHMICTNTTLQWRHNGRDGISNHQPDNCLLDHLIRCRSKKTWKLRVTGLCAENSSGRVNSLHKWPVMQNMFPFDDVIMIMQKEITLKLPWIDNWNNISSEGNLTHWGRVTHICISKLSIICSDNGLSPGRRQAIIWTNAGILLSGPLGTNFSEILIEI